MAILAKGTPAALFILLKWPFSRPPGRPHFVNRRSNRKVKMGLKWYEQGNFERPYYATYYIHCYFIMFTRETIHEK